jgi:hypothetical protein
MAFIFYRKFNLKRPAVKFCPRIDTNRHEFIPPPCVADAITPDSHNSRTFVPFRVLSWAFSLFNAYLS